MGLLEITGPARLLLGLLTGVLFGFILQKGQVTKYQKIVAFFRLTDLTVLKVMFGAILAGMVGVYLLYDLGLRRSSRAIDDRAHELVPRAGRANQARDLGQELELGHAPRAPARAPYDTLDSGRHGGTIASPTRRRLRTR